MCVCVCVFACVCVCVCTTDGEMNEEAEREEKRACYRMTIRDWNCLSGKRYDWTSGLTGRTADGLSYIISMKYNGADDTTKIETLGSQFGNSK